MSNAIIYVHGKGGSAAEATRFRPLFPDIPVEGFDYRATTPWEAKEEFPAYFEAMKAKYGSCSLIANSIGAFFAMTAGVDRLIESASFISPVTDMERLITDMMTWAGVSEERLQTEKEIPTDFGETLSWEYLCYVRTHPVRWNAPTRILYGEQDALIPFETVSAFARATGGALDVMPGGEHWFHTEEQLRYLDRWLR